MNTKIFNVTWIPIGEKELALNPATGAWLLLDRHSKQIISEFVKGASLGEVYQAFPNDSSEVISGLLRDLEEGDFISTEDSGPAHNCDDCHNGRFPKLAVLNFTENCNLNCTYCYVNAGRGQKEYMKPETAFRIVDEYVSMNPKGGINITMHGGEPFLHYGLVSQLTEYVERYRDRVSLSIQTNATLLTDERVQYLKNHNVSIGVSLDGPEEIHNLTRPLQSGDGSFSLVMNGIETLKRNNVNFGIISVLNGNNVDHIDVAPLSA